jgi:serine/threonine protein kinase
MAEPPNHIGQQLGNYRLIKLLGSGGFANVYLGQHIHIASQQAAIKALHVTGVDTDKFRQEAETIASLKHPHIVGLFDFVIQQGTPFLVMDYAPNGSLRKRHATGEKVPLATVVQHVIQIADALQYAHDKHIIHRDIKPDNVLLGSRGDLLLSDFGLAVISQTGRTNSQASHSTAGTPYYMAPEMFKGKPDKASDQYALGVMIYKWLSGTLPFSEGNFIQLDYQHRYEPIPPLREKVPFVSEDVEKVVLTALAKDPHQRFATVQDFATALEQASRTTQPVHKFTPSPPEPSLPKLSRPSTTSAPSSSLAQMLSEMDQALADELEKQQKLKHGKHQAVDGKLVTEENGQYIYQFTLLEPWELKDDARLILVKADREIRCEVVTANGIEITIASDSPLPPDFLMQFQRRH